MEAASQVPAILRGAVQDDLGLVPPDELRHDLGVWSRSVDLEERIVDDDHAVQSVAERVRSEIVDSASKEDARERRVPQIRDATTFADQLNADVPKSLLTVLEEHPHPVEMGLVFEDVDVRHDETTPSAIK